MIIRGNIRRVTPIWKSALSTTIRSYFTPCNNGLTAQNSLALNGRDPINK
jgi:hypothetical protein